MGYETKVYIGTASDFMSENGKRYFMTSAMVDLCKVDYLGYNPTEREAKGIPIFMYGSDGDTKILEDKYGEKLYALPIAEFLERLQKCDDGLYIRYRWLIQLLHSMTKIPRKGSHGTQPTHVVLFGY